MSRPSSPLPPLLSLPTELLDRILEHLLPLRQRPRRLVLSSLLLIHPILTPLVRRRLYSRVSLIVGDTKNRDGRLNDLMDGSEGETEPMGSLVRYLKIRLPDPDAEAWMKEREGRPHDEEENPAAAYLPRPLVTLKETIRRVTRLARAVQKARHIEWDLRCGTRVEGEEEGSANDQTSEADLDRLTTALQGWTAPDRFIYAVEDLKLRLAVWATPGFVSPLVHGMQRWETLQHLDLWHVSLDLPEGFSAPTFDLRTLTLSGCTLSTSGKELEWIIAGGEGRDGRGMRLDTLIVEELEFFPSPPSSSSAASVSAVSPLLIYLLSAPFLHALTELRLTLRNPLLSPSPFPSASSASDDPTLETYLLSPFTSLQTLELAGPGVSLQLFTSVFLSPPSSSSSSSSLSLPSLFSSSSAPPSATLQTLQLSYLPSLPLPTLLSYLSASPPSPSSASAALLSLTKLHLFTGFPLPRGLTWKERRATQEPRWSPLARQRGAGVDEARETEEAWESVEGALRGINRAKGRRAPDDSASGKVAPVRLWRNRVEVDYATEETPEKSSSEGEGNGSEGEGASGSEEDANGLYRPREGEGRNDEEERVWMERRREEMEREEEEGEEF